MTPGSADAPAAATVGHGAPRPDAGPGEVANARPGARDHDRSAESADHTAVVGRLAGGVAHAFSNLLTVVQGHLDRLADELPPSPALDRRLEALRRAVADGGRITSGLRAVAGRSPVPPSPLDLAAAIDEIAPVTATTPDDAETAPRSSMAPRVVLLVEDEPEVRAIVAEILRAQGHRVLEVDGVAAVQRLLAAAPPRLDLLLTDLVLADGTGLETAALVTAHDAAVPVLYMSGYAEAVMPGDRPADHLLRKPFTSAALHDALQRVPARGVAVPRG